MEKRLLCRNLTHNNQVLRDVVLPPYGVGYVDEALARELSKVGIIKVEEVPIEDKLPFQKGEFNFEVLSYLGLHESPSRLMLSLLSTSTVNDAIKPHLHSVAGSVLMQNAPQFMRDAMDGSPERCHVGICTAEPSRVNELLSDYKICIAFTESDAAPESMVASLNKYNEVWTISKWNRKVFVSSGVTVPIYLFRVGINPEEYYFHRFEHETFNIGMAGLLSIRKGIDTAVRAFVDAFPKRNDVRLCIKTRVISPPVDDATERIIDNDDRILVVKEEWDVSQMRGLYQSLDVYLSPTRAEGLGITVLEAAACGSIPIVTNWSGCTEYSDAPFVFIDPIGTERAVGMDGGEWSIPDQDAFTEALRMCYNKRESLLTQQKQCATYVAKKWGVGSAAVSVARNMSRIARKIAR